MVIIRQLLYDEDSYDEEVIMDDKVVIRKVRRGREVEKIERERKPAGKPQL
jgi:hypothetical protein